MDPNVYLSYLCFLKNNSEIYKNFNKDSYNFAFNYFLNSFAYSMKHKARASFLFEKTKAWEQCTSVSFKSFLHEYGTKK